VLERIAGLADELISQAGGEALGIGIGSPGQVNPKEGTVRNAVNLGWEEVRLVEAVRARMAVNLPVWIQKDANASALGEYFFGAAQGCEDFIYMGVGSGLGGGVMTQGVLVTGANQNAAELGHLSLDPQGWRCSCGQKGCAETVVSGPGLVRLARSFLSTNRYPTRLTAASELTTKAILTAARAGDELALAALDEVGRRLGQVMAACVAVLNPALIVIGGGLGLAAFDLLVPAARQELDLRTLTASQENPRILPSQLSSSAVGAACLVWYYQRTMSQPKKEVMPSTSATGSA
jgi:glucokinase